MNEQAERAWTLLRSVEDGEVDYAAVADEVAEAMQQAKAVASTGTVLARLEALDHFEAGRLERGCGVGTHLAQLAPRAPRSSRTPG